MTDTTTIKTALDAIVEEHPELSLAVRLLSAEAKRDPLAEFTEQVTKHYASDVPRGFGWHAENLVATGVTVRWARDFLAALADREGETPQEVAQGFLRAARERVQNLAEHGTNSTNPFSNEAERVELKVLARWTTPQDYRVSGPLTAIRQIADGTLA